MTHQKKQKGPLWLRIVLWTFGSLLSLCIIAIAVICLILTTPALTNLVNRYAPRFLPSAAIHIEAIDLNLSDIYPTLSLSIEGVEVVSRVFEGENEPTEVDSLLAFNSLSLSLDTRKALRGSFHIHEIALDGTKAYIYTDSTGRSNYDLFPTEETTATTDTTAKEESTPLDLQINRLTLSNSRFTYNNRKDTLWATAAPSLIDFDGVGTPDLPAVKLHTFVFGACEAEARMSNLEASARIDSLTLRPGTCGMMSCLSFSMDGTDYLKDFPLGFGGFYKQEAGGRGNYSLRDMHLLLGESDTRINGEVFVTPDTIHTDLHGKVNGIDLHRVQNLVPTGMIPILNDISTTATMDLDLRLQGVSDYATLLPSIALTLNIPEQSTLKFHQKDINLDLTKFGLNLTADYNPSQPDSTSVTVNTLALEGNGVDLSMKGRATEVLTAPFVDFSLNGTIDAPKSAAAFASFLPEMTVQGTINATLHGNFHLSDLNIEQIGNTHIIGRISTDTLIAAMPKDSLNATLKKFALTFGVNENRRDTSVERGTPMVRAVLRSEGIKATYKTQRLTAAYVKVNARSAASALLLDTTKVEPVLGTVELDVLRYEADSTMLVNLFGVPTTFGHQSWPEAANTINFSLLPSKIDKAVPQLNLESIIRTLSIKLGANRFSVNGGEIGASATFASADKAAEMRRAERRMRRLDSLQGIYPDIPRDSLMSHQRALRRGRNSSDSFGEEGNISIDLGEGIGALLEQWSVKASIKAKSGSVTTPFFPLRNRLLGFDIGISTDSIHLHKLSMIAGKSNLSVQGNVTGIKRILQGKRGKLRAVVEVGATALDLDQLMHAASAGTEYATSEEEYRQMLAQQSDAELQRILDKNVEESKPLMVLPDNLDLHAQVNVAQARFSSLLMNNLDLEVIARDRCAQINHMTAQTNVGDMAVEALYASRSRSDITCGFDLELKDILIEDLISSVPMVDSLYPMLSAFRGRVNCQIAATTAIDTMMNLVLPSLNAALRIEGKEMVVMDSVTFRKMSRLLLFKNKKKNMVDRIFVEALVQDNKLLLFPFLIEMDRYKAAASGVQNLDLSFNYHASLIKSPLFFRLGVNLYGSFQPNDKIHYKLVKPRYKSADIPIYSAIIDDTRINLRRYIIDIFNIGVERATVNNLRLLPPDLIE